MKMYSAPTLLTAMLCLFLGACGGAPAKQAEAMPAQPAQPTITAEAQQALTQAEADAKAAKAAYTFWVPAENALKKAQEAAKKGDSAVVLKEAGKVSELCRVSALQPNYPSTEMK